MERENSAESFRNFRSSFWAHAIRYNFWELPNCLVHLRQMSVLVPHEARDHVDIENNNNNNNNVL